MIYYAKLSKQKNNSYLVEFPELQGCSTEGKDKISAIKNAKEALDGWLGAHCDRNFTIPEPIRRSEKNYYPVHVDLNIAFAVSLRILRTKLHLTQSEAAKKLKISQQAYAKLESPETTNPSLSTLKKIAQALHVKIDLKLVS